MKETTSLKKKYDKVKDWKYLSHLYKQCDEDKRAIDKLEKDNKKLAQDQKKADFRLNRKINKRSEGIFGEDLVHTELQDLDKEEKVLQHKADYLQEKMFKDQ